MVLAHCFGNADQALASTARTFGGHRRAARRLVHVAGAGDDVRAPHAETSITWGDAAESKARLEEDQQHRARVHQRDALQLLEAQHAALTAQLAALANETGRCFDDGGDNFLVNIRFAGQGTRVRAKVVVRSACYQALTPAIFPKSPSVCILARYFSQFNYQYLTI